MPYSNSDEQREYQRKWMAKRRSDYFKDKACANCKSKDRLELHHINPDLKVSHRIWSWSKDKREAELKKCIIVCNDCHKTLTKEWYKQNWQHGARRMYENGCKCPACLNYHELTSIDRGIRWLTTGT